MKFAVHVPVHGPYSDPHLLVELSGEAEEAGWDGFFLWDHITLAGKALRVVDPWIALAAIAVHTHRIRLGTMITPLARRRPWKLARETVALDHLSNGRLILGVGLGATGKTEFAAFGEESDAKTRGEKLDEALALLVELWSGRPVDFSGKHYRVHGVTFQPRPIQQPRIPIWVAGYWPRKKPMRRAARWDGAFPLQTGLGSKSMVPPETMAEILAYIRQQRIDDGPFDLVHWGLSSGNLAQDSQMIQFYARAGVTWWFENINLGRGSVAHMREHIRRGPPRIWEQRR